MAEAKQAKKKARETRAPRILQLCAVDFTVRQFLAPLALDLQNQHKCEVDVACTPGPHWDELKSWGLNMIPLKIARSRNLISHIFSAFRLFFLLKKKKYDIVHVHTPIASYIARPVARLAGVNTIIYTAHGFYFHDRMPKRKRFFHILLEKLAAKFHDYLFCVSGEDALAAERLKIDAPSHIYTIRNGVDVAKYDRNLVKWKGPERRKELGIPEEAPVITIIGRMTAEKGFFEFLQAAPIIREEFPDAHFLIIGDTLSSERDRIKRKLQKLAEVPELQGHVHMVGLRSDVPDLLAASTVFTLPSHREGLPVSIIEAMMMGLPVVATRIRGCREEIQDGASGFLVDVGKADELADAVKYLLRHPDTATKMGASGRRRALDIYGLEPVLSAQWSVYERIIRERVKCW
ncbi:glycosyltransferase family 4 protein [bacterium]|nr:glycosyltransferase family 4 protein [bacterium]